MENMIELHVKIAQLEVQVLSLSDMMRVHTSDEKITWKEMSAAIENLHTCVESVKRTMLTQNSRFEGGWWITVKLGGVVMALAGFVYFILPYLHLH